MHVVRVYKGTTPIHEEVIDTFVMAMTFAKQVIIEGLMVRDGDDVELTPSHIITKVTISAVKDF